MRSRSQTETCVAYTPSSAAVSVRPNIVARLKNMLRPFEPYLPLPAPRLSWRQSW